MNPTNPSPPPGAAQASPTPIGGGSRWRWLAQVIVIWGIPAACLWLGLGTLTRLTLASEHDRAFERLDALLTDIGRRSQPATWLGDFLDRQLFAKRLRGAPADPAEVAARVAAAVATLPRGLLRIVTFDGAGRMIPGPDASPQAARLFELSREENPTTLSTDPATARMLAERFALPFSLARAMRNPSGRLTTVGAIANNGAVFHAWTPALPIDRVAGMLAIVDTAALPPDWLFSRVLRDVDPTGPAVALLSEHGIRHAHRPPLGPSLARRLRRRFDREPGQRFIEPGALAVVRRVGPTSYLIGAIEPPAGAGWWLLGPFLVYAAASFFALRAWFRHAVLGWPRRVPIGWRLGGLFALAVGIPLGVAAALVALHLANRRDLLLEDHRRTVIRQFVDIDTRQELTRYLLTRRSRRIIDTLRPLVGSAPVLAAAIEGFERSHRCDQITAIASSQTVLRPMVVPPDVLRRHFNAPRAERLAILGTWLERDSWFNDHLLRIMLRPDESEGGAGRTGIAQVLDGASVPAGLPVAGPATTGSAAADPFRASLNPMDPRFRRLYEVAGMAAHVAYDQRHGRIDGSDRQQIALAGMLGPDGESMLRRAQQAFGQLFQYSNAPRLATRIYSDALPGPGGRPWYALLIQYFREAHDADYLAKVLAGNGGLASPTRLLAASNREFVPNLPRFDEYRRTSHLLSRMAAGQTEMFVREEFEGQDALIVVRRCAAMPDYHLVAITPAGLVDARLARERWGAAGVLALLALVALALGMTLQRQFLRPVAALTAGLAAMRRRDFGFRLEPLADDELGRLGAAFTQALARLADLELGRALQTALAPPARLVVGGYELVAWTRMLQAVGGDYHDFVPLPADRWAVVLGDVAGHGISAALVTAMAKSAFSLLCPRHADHPEIAMAEVNRVLFDSLRKVRLMTCLLGHLDPANGHLALVGAGHPMPLRLRPDGTASEIEALGRPIGIRDNTRYTSQSVAIGDDQLLFYTDGLVECANRAGIPLGFPRFTALAGAARAATGAATIERLLAAVADYTAGADPDDDTTLVLIGRVPPPPAGARAPATATPPG